VSRIGAVILAAAACACAVPSGLATPRAPCVGVDVATLAKARATRCLAYANVSTKANAVRDLAPYRGLGTWVDVYDPSQWNQPEAAVASMAANGARTLFLETSNYAGAQDVFRPDRVSRFIDAAHAHGMRIVAWYVPSYVSLAHDLRRSLAALRFRSAHGGRFDSFALDIEGKVVPSASVRSALAIRLAREVRAAAPRRMALGAIVPSPRGLQLHPHYWPGFPFAALARSLDVFLPMGYFTYRPHYPGGSEAYTLTNFLLLRAWTNDPTLPIHVIGGISGDATAGQVRAFVDAAKAGGAIGLSLYDFAGTSRAQWLELRTP
jgi:hypothetical protein